MDKLTFIVEMSRAWAWPLTVLVLAFSAYATWPGRKEKEP